MSEAHIFKEKPLPLRDIFDMRKGGTAVPEELYGFIVGSFGTGQEKRYRILKLSALNGDEYKFKQMDVAAVVAECMSNLSTMNPSPLGTSGSLERELFKNLLTTKLAVEWAEVKHARLTSDVIGVRALSVWMENQVAAVQPIEDEHSALVSDLAEVTDPEALRARIEALDDVVEEWVAALGRYDLALRELQLESEETVAARFASFMRRGKSLNERASAIPK